MLVTHGRIHGYTQTETTLISLGKLFCVWDCEREAEQGVSHGKFQNMNKPTPFPGQYLSWQWSVLFTGRPVLFPTAPGCREAHMSPPAIVLVVSVCHQSQTKGNARLITSPSCISCSQRREEKQIPEDSFSDITDSIVFKSKHCKQIFYDSPLKKDLYC